MSQATQILNLLKDRGDRGASNFELMQIAFQYPARIHQLRHKDGYNIKSEHVKDKEWKITLIQDETPKAVSWLND